MTRRLYRDGQSDYLLNGVPSRLRDVVEFFLGTGVGSKAYAIIEQGRIGFIVSSRPEDRRGLIDEAAGITRYKSKKKAAERRMDSTRQHLLRVTDIVGEIEGRLRSLRLQAQKAERYKRYKAELRDLDLWSSSQRYLGHLAEEKSADRRARRGARAPRPRRGRAGRRRGGGGGRAAGGAPRRRTSWRRPRTICSRCRTGRSSACSGRRTTKSEAIELTSRAEAGRKEAEELRARAIARGADIEEIVGPAGGDRRRRPSGSEREYDQEARLQDVRRAALIEARGALDGGGGRDGRRPARESPASEAERTARDAAARGSGGAAGRSGRRRGRGRRAARGADVRRERASGAGARSCASGSRRRARRAAEDEARLAALRAELGRGELELETLARGGAPAALAAGLAVGDPGSLRELPEGRSRHHAGAPQGGGTASVTGIEGRRGRHHAAAARAGDRGRGGAGRAARQRHRRIARGRRRGDPVPQAEERGTIVVHPACAALRGAARGGRLRRHERVRRAARRDRRQRAAGDARSVDPAAAIAAAWPKGDGVRGPMLELIGYDRQYDDGRDVPARRRAGGRGSRARAGALARDAHRPRPSSPSRAR